MPENVASGNCKEAPTTRDTTPGGSMTAAGTTVDAAGGGTSDLKRLIRLFTDEDTADLVDRQLVVLRRVCEVRKRGFRYSELAYVEQLLPLLETRVSSGQASEFRAPLLKLLDICSLAPVRERANQEFTEHGLAATRSLFRVLGGALWSSDAGVQSAAATALRKTAHGNDPTRPNAPDGDGNPSFGEGLHDLRPKPRDINLALLLSCGVVTSAVTFLATVMTRMLASVAGLDDLSSQSSSFDDASSSGKRVEAGLLGEEECEMTKPMSEQEGGWQPGGVDLARGDDGSTARVREDQLEVGQADGGGVAEDVALTHMVLVSTLELVRELSTDAVSSAAMVEAGLVSLLVQAMHAVRSVRDPTLSIALEILWNCLEHGQHQMSSAPPAESRTNLVRKARKSNAAFALSSWDGVSALRDTVEALLIGGFRNKDKELRNEAIIVASHLASNGRSHAIFRTTGMLLLLLRYSTAIETGLADGDPHAAEAEARAFALAGEEVSHGSSSFERKEMPELGALADPRNFASMSEVDMELKLLMWSLLSDLCKRDALNVEVVKASPLIETLLMYMDLVVEEGQSADVQPPGMSRSVSLASMPPLGFTQTTSTASGQTPASLEAGDQARMPGEDQGPRRHPHSAALPSPTATVPASGSNLARHPHQGQSNRKGKTLASSECAANTSSSASTREASSAAGGEWEGPDVGFTQLYVPATVVRLPVTSIQLLQGQAMASLLVLAPRCPRKFQALGGHTVTLRLLDRLGSRPENHRLVKVATKMLATVVGLPGLKEELGRVDGVRIMLDRFSDEWKREKQGGGGAGPRGSGGGGGSGGCSEGAGDLRTDTVIILCRLCENCPENQEAFRKADGVPTMMAAVKAYCQEQSEAMQQECAAGNGGGGSAAAGSGGSTLGLGSSARGLGSGGSSGESIDPSLVHIIDCLWCAVVGNRRSEARLLQCEGLDTLLDLLELCPVFMRHQVTGIVADLLRNKRSIPYARAWRSDLNMLSVTQLMVRLWVAEEARLGVSRPNGVLQNLWQPLQSHDRGSRRRKWTAQSAKREWSVMPTNGASMDPVTTTSEYDALGARESRLNASCVALEPDDSAEGNPGATPDSVVAGLAAVMSEADGLSETARISQNSSETPSAMTLSLQAGTRAAGVGQNGGRGQEANGSHAGVDSLFSKAMGHLDLRGKIAAVLGMVGFDGGATDGLGPSDLKASYMASTYMDFRVGEAWQEVAGELEAQHINPIAADAFVLDTMLEKAFDSAQEVKSKQMTLTAEQEERDAEAETAFFAGILFQRDQEIRQAIIKRNALLPGTSKKRLAAKKAERNNTTKKSSDKSPRGSSAECWTGSEQGTSEDAFEGERNAIKEAAGGAGVAAAAVGSQ